MSKGTRAMKRFLILWRGRIVAAITAADKTAAEAIAARSPYLKSRAAFSPYVILNHTEPRPENGDQTRIAER